MLRIAPKRLRKLLKELVDIYSPSGKEEEVLDFAGRYLQRRGLPVTTQPVDDNRSNLVVAPAGRDTPLAFIGHLDTVPAPDLDNYGFAEDGDRVSGLGVADMKGGCAAMMEALVSLWEAHGEDCAAALCLVVGEEETGDGAEQLLKTFHYPWTVIGEPTDLIPCFSSYGYVEIELSTRGPRLHASQATPGRNAVEVMFQHLLQVTRHIESAHPDVSYNVRDLFSAPSGFAVPDRCEAWLDLHLPPAAPIGAILAELEEVCTRGQDPAATIETRFRSITIAAGYEIPAKGPVAEAIASVYQRLGLPWQTGAFRSHSDANQIWAAGIKPIVLGPGQLGQAHTPEESASFGQICQAAQIYLDIMVEFLKDQ
jgi:acetylornithine deacetylase